MNEVFVIGIAGGSGSGKSTLTENLRKVFPDSVTVLRHDDYYKAQHELSYEERCLTNYDHPDAFETQRMIRDIQCLKNYEAVECPVYDFTIHDRSDDVRVVEPAPVLLIDGILIFENKELLSCMDLKVFVDTDADVRILRRAKRDILKRGRSFESVFEQYLTTVKPMHDLYVQPSAKEADIIIRNGGKNPQANALLESRIRQHLDTVYGHNGNENKI